MSQGMYFFKEDLTEKDSMETNMTGSYSDISQRMALDSAIVNTKMERPIAAEYQTMQLTDFEFLRTLGTGTFGRVFLVRERKYKRYFAMKVLKKVEIVRLKQVEHIISERAILMSVDFPFIVRLYRTFQDNRSVYMLMDYIPGGELFSHLRRAGRFPSHVARWIAAEIVVTLEYLHSKNIVYRDLKPENLLLDRTGHIIITDFGFAKTIKDRTWTLCGTPEYLAPEIIQSKGHGKAVDWWALGILIYEMLAGYPPFFDNNPFGIYEKILLGKVRFPSHFDTVEKDLIQKLLVKDRALRLGNLRDGADDIKEHAWFAGIDWQVVLSKSIMGPIVPECKYPGDTSNFESYPEPTEEEFRDSVIDPFRSLFLGF
jgi:serine/threonine protein kinase